MMKSAEFFWGQVSQRIFREASLQSLDEFLNVALECSRWGFSLSSGLSVRVRRHHPSHLILDGAQVDCRTCQYFENRQSLLVVHRGQVITMRRQHLDDHAGRMGRELVHIPWDET